MTLKTIGLLTGMLLLPASLVMAQPPAPTAEQAKELAKHSSLMQELQRLTMSPKLALELELTPDQKQQLQVAAQKATDTMMKQQRENAGGKFDMEGFKKLAEGLTLDAKKILTPKQFERLSKTAQERAKKQQAQMPDQDQIKEMQQMNTMMMELQRLSYDLRLAQKLELTTEQRVKIREASQQFQLAMQERRKANEGGAFDMVAYNEMMRNLMMEAQEILTPEQSKKLSRTAKLKRLRQQGGDEFAMINGLAKDFDLEPDETKALKEEIVAARDVYYAELMKLKEDTLERIIRKLPAEHREEAKEAAQEFFEVDPRKRGPYGAFGG